MRVSICSSSKNNIDDIYKEESKRVIEYLAENNWDLNWGAGSEGIMGICYEIFSKYNRKIYGYTTPKYIDMLNSFSNVEHYIYEDTFLLKQNLFNDGDIILVLPGGLGSISEFLAYLEENRSNDRNKKIILYNVNHYYDKVLDELKDLVDKRFNDESIYDYFVCIDNLEDFKNSL